MNMVEALEFIGQPRRGYLAANARLIRLAVHLG